MKTLYKNIALPEIKEDSLIRESKLFAYIDSDFVNYGADIPNKENTSAISCEVKELTENMTFNQMFNAPNTQWLNQGQILKFIENNKDKLTEHGYATFFLFKSGNDFFVAGVDVSSDGLDVDVRRFEGDDVWDAERRHRVVVPQLETKSLDPSEPLSLEPFDPLSEETAIGFLKEKGYRITKMVEKEF